MKEWAKQFRLGRESIEDDPRDGRPVEVVTEENVSLVEDELSSSDRRLKLKEISARLELSITTVFRIIHEKLHMTKVSARWVPRLLSPVQEEHRVTCSRKFL